MSSSINKVILVGNVGQDPEFRTTNDGREMATFSLATSEAWVDKRTNEKKEKIEWHRIVIFSQGLVKISKSYLKKGMKLYLEGSLQTRKWQDQTGIDKYTTEIILQGFSSVLIMLDSKGHNVNADNSFQGSNLNNNQSSEFGFSENASPNFIHSNYDDARNDDNLPW